MDGSGWVGGKGSLVAAVWMVAWVRWQVFPREAVAGQGRHCSRWSAACQNYTIGLPFCHRPQVLDFGLHHANSAVVMATAKLFLHYTMAFNSQHQQVRLRCCGVATACYALLGGWLPAAATADYAPGAAHAASLLPPCLLVLLRPLFALTRCLLAFVCPLAGAGDFEGPAADSDPGAGGRGGVCGALQLPGAGAALPPHLLPGGLGWVKGRHVGVAAWMSCVAPLCCLPLPHSCSGRHLRHTHFPPALHPQLYPEFFCRYEDPSYLKSLKIEVLIAIADQTNAYEIAEEMTQVGGRAGGWVGDP